MADWIDSVPIEAAPIAAEIGQLLARRGAHVVFEAFAMSIATWLDVAEQDDATPDDIKECLGERFDVALAGEIARRPLGTRRRR
jgi:hypothetical protein